MKKNMKIKKTEEKIKEKTKEEKTKVKKKKRKKKKRKKKKKMMDLILVVFSKKCINIFSTLKYIFIL